MDDGFDGLAVTNDQGPDSFRGADLVAGDGEESAGKILDRQGELAEGLDGIAVEKNVAFLAPISNGFDGLAHAGFVVDPHDRNDRRLAEQLFIEGRQVELAGFEHRQGRFFAAEMRHLVGGREHRLVLHRGNRHSHGAASIAGGKRGWTQAVPLLRSSIEGTPTLTLKVAGTEQALAQGEQVAVRAALDGAKSVDIANAPLVWVSRRFVL